MFWNDHKKDVPEGVHAFLSASKYHWINYDDDKLQSAYNAFKASAKGTELHDLAKNLILNKIKLPRSNKTFNLYVNDAIGFKMDPEVLLKYSKYCYGTADAIYYSDKQKILRIHDLKTGKAPVSFNQLKIYAALFFLEYGKIPGSVSMELRIYFQNEALINHPEADDILPIMDKIIRFDKILTKMDEDEYIYT